MTKQLQILPNAYKKITIIFFTVSIFLFIFSFYLIWSKVTITLVPSQERLEQEMVFDIQESTSSSSDIVQGKIESVELSGSENFKATGTTQVNSDIVGELTIYNNYSKEQVLIASTRLADPSNPSKTLVRLKDNVTVPAGGTVKVQVYADDSENFETLPPMKFVIPGLWEGLQKHIFAESKVAFSSGGYKISVVTEDDLNLAKQAMSDKFYDQAFAEVEQRLQPEERIWPRLVTSNVSDTVFSAKSGDQTSDFSAQVNVLAVVVAFNEDQLIAKAKEKIEKGIGENKKIVSIDEENITYELQEYNLVTKKARIKATLKANSVLNSDTSFIDFSKITGKTEQEVQEYFSQFATISEINVEFKPVWLKKTPKSSGKIKIEVSE